MITANDYIHLDVSDQFADEGKTMVSVLWLVSMVIIQFGSNNNSRGVVALTCGLVMLVLRKYLTVTSLGPEFDVSRHVMVEPLIFLAAMMMLKDICDKYFTNFAPSLQSTSAVKIFLGSSFLGAISNQTIPLHFFENDTLTGQLMVSIGSALGATLTFNGHLSSLIIVLLAYDDIGWTEYAQNFILPVLAMHMIALMVLGVAHLLAGGNLLSNHNTESTYERVVVVHSQDEENLMENESQDAVVKTDSKETPTEKVVDSKMENQQNITTAAVDDPTMKESGTTSTMPNTGIVWLYFVATVSLYAMDIGFFASCAFMVVLLFWAGRLVTATSQQSSSLLVDLDPLLYFIGIALLMGSYNDTGRPQSILNTLYGENADDLSLINLMHTRIIHFTLGFIFSPLAMSMTFAATFPYYSPYGWLQMALQLSMAQVGRSIVIPIVFSKKHSLQIPEKACLLLVLMTLVFLSLSFASSILSNTHFSPECSVRLGECMGF